MQNKCEFSFLLALCMYFKVFDKNWHKIHFGVYQEQVVLYVDCEETTMERLEPRGPIDVNGEITIAKVVGKKETVPVSIN